MKRSQGKSWKELLSDQRMRLAIMLALSLLLVLVVSLTAGKMSRGHSQEGLYYEITGLRPDGVLMEVNGEPITVEEYLYWVFTDCNYLMTYGGVTDLTAPLTDDMTYADYVRSDVAVTIKLYGAVRAWAKANDVTLTDAQKQDLADQRRSYVDYYGSEEAYLGQLAVLGISEECFDLINETPYLYSRMVELYTDPDSAFYPGDDVLKAFAAEQGLISASLAYYTVDEEADEDKQAALAEQFAQYAEDAAVQADKAAFLAALPRELPEVTVEPTLTFLPTEGDPISDTASALEIGEISGVVEDGAMRYIILRQKPDLTMAASEYVSHVVEEKRDSAVVVYNSDLYDALDVAGFYTALAEAQQSLAASTGF